MKRWKSDTSGKLKNVPRIMEMVKQKPRRRSVSELFDWRCVGECKGSIVGNGVSGGEGFSLEDRDIEPETRRRRRSGTWP